MTKFINCKNREEARKVAKEQGGKVVDNGKGADVRWQVQVQSVAGGVPVTESPVIPVEEVAAVVDVVPAVQPRKVMTLKTHRKSSHRIDPKIMKRHDSRRSVSVYTKRQYLSMSA